MIRGRNRIALFLLFALISSTMQAQQQPLVLRATSRSVDIRDGDVLRRGVWNLSPEIRPDVYYVLEPLRPKRITFYTDVDSLSLPVIPGQQYDFIIVLNKTDTCYTRIETALPPQPAKVSVDPVKRFSVKELQQDFGWFRKNLRQYHAGLYRYRPPHELESLLDSCYASLSQPLTATEFCNVIRYVISAIECGHTACSLPTPIMDWYENTVKMFPLQLWFADRKSHVLCDNRQEIPSGTEVVSIDGQPIDEIRQTLFRYLPSDGAIQTRKYWIMNREGFPFLYQFVYGDKTAFTVQYKTPKGAIQTVTLPADSLVRSQCHRFNTASGKPLQLIYEPDNVAILTIRTFSNDRLKAVGENFERFLKTAFNDLQQKKVSRLLIDVRGNGGGDDINGALLYSYLTQKPFSYFATLQSTTQTFRKKTDHPGLESQQPSLGNYRGRVYFLIDGLSFSTTADFCAIAKSNGRGTFIGEETGGGYAGNNSGEMFRAILPHTAINIAIPKIRYSNAVTKNKYPNRGVLPDYPIRPSVEEVLQRKDIALPYALRLLRKP